MCQKVEADTLIEDTVHKLIIDGKSVMGMMTVTLNQRLIFVVDGSDEKEVLSTFEKYRWIRLIRAGEKGNRCKSCTNSSL